MGSCPHGWDFQVIHGTQKKKTKQTTGLLEERLEKMNTDNINPQHYQKGKIEVIDFILDQKMSYLTASACKYLCRWEHKHLGEGRLDDLRKARWFIEKQIEEILKEENIK